MSAEIKTKPSGKTFTDYSCTNAKRICKRVYVPEKTLLEPIYAILGRFESITEEAQNELVDELRKNTEAEVVFHRVQSEVPAHKWQRCAFDGRGGALREPWSREAWCLLVVSCRAGAGSHTGTCIRA